jgi:hypothetical protein
MQGTSTSRTVVGTMRAGGGFSNFHAWIYVDGAVRTSIT